MTELLEKAIEKARALPDPDQDEVAALLLEAMRSSDERWKSLFANPRSEELLEKLWAEAEQEIARGEVYDMRRAPTRT